MNYEKIKPYIEKGLVSEQSHPDHAPYKIFNYTQRCQFERIWDDVTKNCRGLILDTYNGTVVARPFAKFFNYGEHTEKGWEIPSELPVITEKLDGSLGILYWLHGKPWIATRGSFTSDQAVWATKWFRENVGEWNRITNLTHLFEIIYPENRIVVNYDFSGLVHISTRDTETGQEVDYKWPEPIRTAKRSTAVSLAQLAKLDEPNSEGFVAYYPKANTRIKLKFPEYVRLHKIITGVSEIGIWEMMKDGQSLDELLEKVPDEFFKWVQETENKIRAQFASLWGNAQMAVQMVHGKETRKDQAIWIMKNAKDVSGVVFALLDGEDKKASAQVWKMIRPHGKSGFKTDIDL